MKIFGTSLAIKYPGKLLRALRLESEHAEVSLEKHILDRLRRYTPPIEQIDKTLIEKNLPKLGELVESIPGVKWVSHGLENNCRWWIKFEIDIEDEIAWYVIQELGYILNYISISERLPTVFAPVSPPPYLNSGPKACLSWIIEPKFDYIDPQQIADVLDQRLPKPITERDVWLNIKED